MKRKKTNNPKTKCSRCKRPITIDDVAVYKNGVKQDSLYVAHCSKCNHTIYSDTMEEALR